MHTDPQVDSPKVNPLDYVSRTEWYGNSSTPAMRWLAEQDEATFEAALAAAKAEGNLSRANLARKMGWTPPDTRRTRHNLTAQERGYAAILRLARGIDDGERDAWLDGAMGAVEDSR